VNKTNNTLSNDTNEISFYQKFIQDLKTLKKILGLSISFAEFCDVLENGPHETFSVSNVTFLLMEYWNFKELGDDFDR
jgi:hypothetical protein